jgi:hypothetical protein
MALKLLLAAACIVLAFIAGFVDEDVLFSSLVWFVASIAFSLLPFDYKFGR